MTSRHPPVSHIAGAIAAQEGRIPSHALAQVIIDRLHREGFAIVRRDSEAAAYQDLVELDEVLNRPGSPRTAVFKAVARTARTVTPSEIDAYLGVPPTAPVKPERRKAKPASAAGAPVQLALF
jgi:hypothetical protein